MKEKAIFFADWHLIPEASPQTQFFCKFVDSVCADATRVFVLGDLFYAWVGPKHASRPGHLTALNKLAELAKHCPVTIIKGNRDFLLDKPTLDKFGLELSGEAWQGQILGTDFYLTHGDRLSTDWLHKLVRGITGNFPTSTALKTMPVAVSDKCAATLRFLSKKRRGDEKAPAKYQPAEPFVREIFKTADVLIIGHWHQTQFISEPYGLKGKTFVRLGECCFDTASYAVMDERGIRLEQFKG